jgi:2,3-bisphosphoglycerate-independent phosphoglycerate mutase
MSARLIADRVLSEMRENKYDFIVMNFANPDMVGHTGDLEAAKKGLAVLDECLGKIVEETLARNGRVFITADHGNAEEMKNLRTGERYKEHATNPVPFLIISKDYEGQPSIAGEVPDGDLSLMTPIGMLADVAPTILATMGLEQPPEMTGQPLI